MSPTQSPESHAEYSLQWMDKSDLPRERLRRLGSTALKTEELIAIILRTGTRAKMFCISPSAYCEKWRIGWREANGGESVGE